MSIRTPKTPEETTIFTDANDLSDIGTFNQPSGPEGSITATVLYATPKYGTRPPAGFITNLGGVIQVIDQLSKAQASPPNPELQPSITAAILYLEYLQSFLSGQLTQVVQNLISNAVEITL